MCLPEKLYRIPCFWGEHLATKKSRKLDTSNFLKMEPANIPEDKPFVVIDISEMWAGNPPKPCALAKALHIDRSIHTFIKCKDTCVNWPYSESGDYEIHIPLEDGSYTVLGIERKSFSDYYGRIAMAKDDRKHFDHQLLRLVDRFGPNRSFVLVEAYKNKPAYVTTPVHVFKQAVSTGINHRNILVPHLFSENTKQSVDLFKWLIANHGCPTIENDIHRMYRKVSDGATVFEARFVDDKAGG